MSGKEAEDDLAVTQARDTAALAHGLIDGLVCATCDGTGWVTEAAGYVGGVPAGRQRECRDCDGTGHDPAEEPI